MASTTTDETIRPAASRRRGFAVMARDKHRAIAARGGRRAHELGVAHEWSAEEAKAAGRKGGAKRMAEETA